MADDQTGFGMADDQTGFGMASRPVARGQAAPGPAGPDGPTAAENLRAWEDDHFGDDALRIDGKIEKGHGSKLHALDDAEKAEHSALEQLVEAENKLAQAMAALDAARIHHAQTVERIGVHHDTAERAKSEKAGRDARAQTKAQEKTRAA